MAVSGIASADGLISTKSKGAFIEDISSSLFTGVTKGGETILITKSIYESDASENLWGLPLNFVKYEAIQLGNLDGTPDSTELFEQTIFAGNIGDSDTFYLSLVKNDNPYDDWGAGFIYDPSHWGNIEGFDCRVGTYMLESGRGLILVDARYEIATGYWINAEADLGMEAWGNRDYLDGAVYLSHNLKPDGSMILKGGIMNLAMENYIYAGIDVVIF